MSEVYNIYEASFKSQCKNIDSILNKEEYTSSAMDQLRNHIKEINRLIKQMNLEISNLKLSNHKVPKEIEENLKKYKSISDEYNNKLILIQNEFYFKDGTNKKNILVDYDEQKGVGLIQDEYTHQQRINDIHKDLIDIEHIGYDISNNLDMQNEQIKYMNNDVKMMDHEADLANELVNQIINRARRNKIIFYISLTILIVVFTIVMIIKKKNG